MAIRDLQGSLALEVMREKMARQALKVLLARLEPMANEALRAQPALEASKYFSSSLLSNSILCAKLPLR